MHEVTIYADGACSGNPGPAGIGVILVTGQHRKEISRPIGHGTNNIAEYAAAIEGLKALRDRGQCGVTLYTDSQLVVGMLNGWKAKVNLEMVDEMRNLAGECASFKAVHVKGHNGDALNEHCAKLAKAAAKKASFVVGSFQAQEAENVNHKQEEGFETQVNRFISRLEQRGLEVEITTLEPDKAWLDVYCSGKVVSELTVVPGQNSKGADSGVEAECCRCHAVMACPFYGSAACSKFTLH